MRFIARSLGGKLITIATLILLSCLLLFSIVTWLLTEVYTEQSARNGVQGHLTLLTRAYQGQIATLLQELDKLAKNPQLPPLLNGRNTQNQLQELLSSHMSRLRLSTISILTRDQQQKTQLGEAALQQNLPPLDPALTGEPIIAVQKATESDSEQNWVLTIVQPIGSGKGQSLLIATQRIDNYFVAGLTQRAGTNAALCIEGEVRGIAGVTEQQIGVNEATCQAKQFQILEGKQRFLTLSDQIQLPGLISPDIVLVAIDSYPGVDYSSPQILLIFGGSGLCIFALGLLAYMSTTRMLLIQPLRQLQANLSTSLTPAQEPETSELDDDLNMLEQRIAVLNESREKENQAMTEQMRNLLTLSDGLISTLNLEHLLGEIVTRLGTIMKVKHVSLHLYGREMLQPWAVAQWELPKSKQVTTSGLSYTPPVPSHEEEKGKVSVYADPGGDITLAATTKMAALPNLRQSPAPQSSTSVGIADASSRIPRSALRELDMKLAQMVIQKKKIAYAENIDQIYEEKQEVWARLALEAGYHSVVAVPLLLQEQAIGAFILYADQPNQISGRDTFLLSTAAIQASMAIQNAILFAEVKEKNAELERANQLKSQFLANVTHELRTPLHSIISYGALILEGFVDGELTTEQEEHIQFIVKRAEDLSHLVDDMLDLSKIEADRIEVNPEALNLERCLQDVVNQLKPMANNKNLALTLEGAHDLPPVLADEHRLRQVAINLISNALKFTETGGVTIRCHCMSNNERVRVLVSDTGIGISPAALHYIFEAFRQADGSTTRKFGGTGLGLTIAKKLIELQGGEMTVESIPGQGSTFSFTLPIAPLHQGM
ncbi:signal transduction histidine kinase [Thermosporothrix hazakensis]|jgi:signal transduction histidine kinase|uniref:Circadian input-output histidine kinase CikA n=1 Tax=Thermosporothrix hazakensis TaxID=644383 RepID=A0A326UEE3_THEHA|nr:ATP-binding protein [Thermosporothrix hazakensis]PZW36285.1 signal transduction histidine kinase [Thermosporothrix hazakensis]GCE46935.1 hypothetical protein KTH_18040 [Thermosporothrix hazakensis]